NGELESAVQHWETSLRLSHELNNSDGIIRLSSQIAGHIVAPGGVVGEEANAEQLDKARGLYSESEIAAERKRHLQPVGERDASGLVSALAGLLVVETIQAQTDAQALIELRAVANRAADLAMQGEDTRGVIQEFAKAKLSEAIAMARKIGDDEVSKVLDRLESAFETQAIGPVPV
ncbi:MAG: hypothetical protein QGF59_26860, partial [Pirellulaceae bacterium]|nr:hypothetical protein [Pirellulaceae bacterium]